MSSIPPSVILFSGAILLLLLPRRVRSAAFLMFPALTFWWLLSANPGDSLSISFLNYALVPVRVDQLSLVFGYVFVMITFLGGIYAYHVKDKWEQSATLLYAGSSLGAVFAGDLFTLVVFWEIMAISSVYLVWARRSPTSRGAGMRYLMMHLFGGSVLIAGTLMHVTQAGSIMFDHLDFSVSSYLILFAFCLNAAVPPLQAWLSDAYPEGTVTGSVFLSAFTTKTAVYVLARGFAEWEILVWAGSIMAVYGVIYAVLQNDARRLLAYHIISQVGYMVAGIGLGTFVSIDGAAAHAFTHILYKALLFMGVGTVLYATGRSKLTELGGLARAMPWVLVLYMIGAFSISGVPLFSGFVSKSMVIYGAGLTGSGIAVVMLTLASVGTFLSVGLKLPYFAWFGPKSKAETKPIPPGMYVGMGITAGICIVIGVYPTVLYNILPYPVDFQPYSSSHVIETLQLLIFSALGFWLLLKWLHPKDYVYIDTDWLYRRPARLAYHLFIIPVNRAFANAEAISARGVRALARIGANPINYLPRLIRFNGKHDPASRETGSNEYDPDRARLPIEPMVLILLVFFVALIAWGLFRL